MRAAEPEKQAALGNVRLVEVYMRKAGWCESPGTVLSLGVCTARVPSSGDTQKRTCEATPHPPGFFCHKQVESRQEAASWPRGQSFQFSYCWHLSSCSNEICKSVKKFYYKVSITQGKAKQNYVMKYTFALTQLHHCAKDANIFLNTSQH